MKNRSLVDLHNHLLPNVDDGSRSAGETLEYLERWSRDGVAAVTFTPHLVVRHLATARDIDARVNELSDAFEALLFRAEGRADLPRLALGQEVCVRNGEEMARVADNPRVGLGGTEYMLVEFGFAPGWDAEGVLAAAAAAGRRVILAHPERYVFPADADPVTTIAHWRDAGTLIQVNGGSVMGSYTTAARSIGERLMLEDVATIVASDHHGHHRPHEPAEIYAFVSAHVGADHAAALMGERPGLVRMGQLVDVRAAA